jgi:hypothetical protein
VKLLTEARKAGQLTAMEYDAFDRARKIRNPVTHFRRPSQHENIEARMLQKDEYPCTLIEQDARIIAAAVMHMVGRNAV